jgi:hypothetical protein
MIGLPCSLRHIITLNRVSEASLGWRAQMEWVMARIKGTFILRFAWTG